MGKEAGITADAMPDDKWNIQGFRQAPYWKRVARAIEKMISGCQGLSFGVKPKGDVKRLFELKRNMPASSGGISSPQISSSGEGCRRIEDEFAKEGV